ncbi:MAG TPA: MtrB/PioB family outer membrane beta-barrel protein [Gemmatimonadaceae bacterium]|jgi:MtrB/PioB family decaheme-associated outer membrane protein|nr:MtrB/PioB family outer membrane beta-barrel protein [Gemmatimonadaceae bacterium]
MRYSSIGFAMLAAAAVAAGPTALVGQAPSPSPVPAKPPMFPWLVVGAEMGGGNGAKEPSTFQLGKLEEYKSVPKGFLVRSFYLGYQPPDSFRTFGVTGVNLGQIDQSLTGRVTQPGVFDVRLQWDRIPHTFSSNARSLGTQTEANLFVLPNPRPDTGVWNRTAPYLDPIRMRWDNIKLATTYTPSPAWDFKIDYLNIAKTGERPMGMAFGSPGSNLREILEPIDQRTNDVKLSQAYTSDRLSWTALYNLSTFHNGFTSVTSDNPALAQDSPTAGSSRGRTALAPDNVAHTAVVNAALSLPAHTRVNAGGSYAWWHQNAPFIPPTINSAINDPRVSQLPHSLGGVSGTSTFNVAATSRPFAGLAANLKFRQFAFRDHVDVDTVPVLIVNDRSVSNGVERDRFPSTRSNTDASLSWRLNPLVLGVGYNWDHWRRNEETRNVWRTNDNTARASVDFDALDWVSLRTVYTKAHRRASDPYNQNTPDDLPEHRRFDQADRDRERTSVIALFTPAKGVTLSSNWGVGHDEYPASAYGTQSDRSTMLGGDASWELSDRFSIDGGYSRETFVTRLRSRYRVTGQLANLSYDWVADNRDRVSTTTAGFDAVLVPDRIEVGGRVDVSHARFVMATYNPTTPTGGTSAQNIAATASDLPVVTQNLQPMSIFARYHMSSDWAATLRIQTERYDQNDFRTLGLLPAEGNGIFLGNNFENYNVTYVVLTFSFRPALLRGARPPI